jgi:hypothetical protein
VRVRGAVAPVVVTDAAAMAPVLAAVVGLTPRQLRDLVEERHIRHESWSRHIYVRVDDVLRGLGLGDASAPASSPLALSEDEVVELAVRPRGPR